MNLKNLTEWCNKMNTVEELRIFVRKDAKGAPRTSDIIVCRNLLKEIINRVVKVNDFNAKAEKDMAGIITFLKELDKRGVYYQINDPEPPKPKPELTEQQKQNFKKSN